MPTAPDTTLPLLERAQPHAHSLVVGSRWSRRDWLRRRMLALVDVTALIVALLLCGLSTQHDVISSYLLWGAPTLPMWLGLFLIYGLYDRDAKRIGHSTLDDVSGLFHAMVMGGLLTWVWFRVGPVQRLSFWPLLVFTASSMCLVLSGRAIVRHYVRRGGSERALLVGGPEMSTLVAAKLTDHPEYALDPVGRLSADLSEAGPADEDLPVLGGVADVARVAETQEIERVIVSSRCLEEDELLLLLRRCRELGLKVSIVPEMFDVMGPSVEVDVIAGLTLLGLNPAVLSRSSRMAKRGMDILGSAVALILLSPVLLAVAVAVKLDSRGPILFRQRRIGRQGHPFLLNKFRTMCVDAEARREELLAQSTDPGWLKLDHDPRITRVGRFLRMTSLDELPQLCNVLRGDMSLVGPRPIIESEHRMVEDWGRARLDLTPGITGLWQVLGRTNIPFAEMVKLDYLYVTNWSLWTDCKLILRTLPAVLRQRGAN